MSGGEKSSLLVSPMLLEGLMTVEMQKASAKLEFEKAAHLRDQIKELKQRAGIEAPPPNRKAKVKYNLARKIENDD